MIDVVIPTFGRPDRLSAVLNQVHAATRSNHRVIFVPEEDDEATLDELERLGAVWTVNQHKRNYAGAVNTAFETFDGELIFAGADDLHFHHGWDEPLLELRDGWFGVYGTNDLLNPFVLAGTHATHYLVERTYLEDFGGVVDEGPFSFLCEAYSHQFTDTEFIGTAKMRARFRPCLESVVEHRHFTVGKADFDETYGLAYRFIADDEALYDERRDLWFAISR